jgi:hypothetical protein
MPTLEQQITSVNAEIQDCAQRNSDELVAYFAGARAELAGIGTDRLAVAPVLVPEAAARRLAGCHRALREALDLIFAGRLGGSWRRLGAALRLDAPTFEYLDRTRPPRWLSIARPDVVLHGDSLTMVEPNAGSPCGGRIADAEILGRLFERSPVFSELLARHGARRLQLSQALAAYLRTRLAESGRSPAGALVVIAEFKAELDGAHDPYQRLARQLRDEGLRAEVAAVEDLDASAAGVAWAGQRCDLIYRFASEEPDPPGNYPALAPILAAGRRGNVVLVDDLGDAIALNKTVLATLSEELDAGTLPGRLSDQLAAFVPWSRVLEDTCAPAGAARVTLPDWCAAHQDALVLKPGAGYQGRGVTIGCEASAAAWAAALDAALASPEPWLVQELARSAPVPASTIRDGRFARADTYVDYSYFAIGGTAVAGMVRKSAIFGSASPSRLVKHGPFGPVFVY